MLLTIGMIVKNEEKYLRRCLTAIKPILDKVDSELIITDTGSTDSTVEIAKEFTDKVLHFDWINDFAAARNTTIENAQGEWYMFLDADEIFQSCNRIIKFFNSGEYKSYNSATYIVRSYPDLNNMADFSDFSAQRMVKMTPDMRFKKPIHEHLSSFDSPIKILLDVADHYGYAFNDAELSEAKYQRNIAILEKTFEEDKETDPTIYGQMFDTYLIKDEEKAIEYLDMGIDFLLKRNDKHIIGLYAKKANLFHIRKDFDGVLAICEEYFNLPEAIRPSEISSDVEMRLYQALAYALSYRLKEAIEGYKQYFRLYDLVTKGTLHTVDMLYYSLSTINEKVYKDSCDNYLKICIALKEYKDALIGFKRYPISRAADNTQFVNEHIKQAMIIFENIGYRYLNDIFDGCDTQSKALLIEKLRTLVLTNSQNNRQEIISAVLSLKELAPEHKAIFTIYKAHFSPAGAGAERIATFIKKYNAVSYPELLYFLIAEKHDISAYAHISNIQLANITVDCIRQCPGFIEAIVEYPIEQITKMSLYPLSRIYISVLIHRSRRGEDIEAIFDCFGRVGLKYFDSFPDDTPQADEMLPAALAFNITAERRQGDYQSCLNDLELFSQADPKFDTIAAQYEEIINSEYNAPDSISEMQQLAAIVKNNVRSLIAAGDYINATETLSELEQLCPDDSEIAELKAQLPK